MKWWNKDREIRRKTWTKINLDKGYPLWAHDVKKVTEWCKAQNSPGKFYHYFHTWWFEYPQDATLFALKWS